MLLCKKKRHVDNAAVTSQDGKHRTSRILLVFVRMITVCYLWNCSFKRPVSLGFRPMDSFNLDSYIYTMTWNYELKKPLIFLCSVMPYNAGHGTYCLTSVDITFDSRESLYFAITFPENGRLFEKLEAVKGLFCKGLRGFARKCEISWSHPDDAPHDVTFCFGKTCKPNKIRHFSPFRLTSKWAVYI